MKYDFSLCLKTDLLLMRKEFLTSVEILFHMTGNCIARQYL